MQETPTTPVRLTKWEFVIYAAIIAAAALVRIYALDRIPPGLWYDEAIYALDGLSVARGHFPIFFETYGHMREPLYIYSLGGFFALFGHSTYQARLVSALWGIATVAIFFPVARRFVGNGWGLAATFVLSTFRWHVHFSRTIFRAVLPPFFILAAIWFFLRWREQRRPADAIICGTAIGAGMYTYLSFRLVPLIFAFWIAWLLARKELIWKRDRSGLGLIVLAAGITFSPLAIDYLKNPVHFTGRTSEITMFHKEVMEDAPGGGKVSRRVAKSLPEIMTGLSGNACDIALMWTVKGDHVGKHNLPYAPVFDWVCGTVFYVGVLWSLCNLARNQIAFLALAWLSIMSLASLLSFGAPNLLRMQGATPAVALLFVLGLKFLYVRGAAFIGLTARRVVVGCIILTFSVHQIHAYFIPFPASAKVRQEFLTEMFYEPAEAVKLVSRQFPRVYVPEEMAETPTFRFVTAEIPGVRPYGKSLIIPAQIELPAAVLVTARSLQLANETGQDHLSALLSQSSSSRISRFYISDTEGRKQQWAELWTLK